jgi:hypothetical protein
LTGGRGCCRFWLFGREEKKRGRDRGRHLY